MITPPAALLAGLDELAGEVGGRRLGVEAAALRTAYRGAGPGAPRTLRPGQVAAYAVYRMPATFAAVRAALAQLAASVPGFAPCTLLDVGGGTGAATWAARDAFASLTDATLLERDPAMAAVGSRLAAAGGLRARWTSVDVTAPSAPWPPLDSVDLAVAAYVLGELDRDGRDLVLQRMLTAAPTVVVVEPGTPRGFEVVLAARRTVISADRRIAAPCPGDGPCPMARSDWCHLSVRLPRTPAHRRAKGGELGYEDEKFSYVAATSVPVSPTTARVVRHPRIRGGHVRLPLCTAGGLVETTITRTHRDRYRAARRAGWGDRWDVDGDGAPGPAST